MLEYPPIVGFYLRTSPFYSLLQLIYGFDKELDKDGDFSVYYYEIYMVKSGNILTRKAEELKDWTWVDEEEYKFYNKERQLKILRGNLKYSLKMELL